MPELPEVEIIKRGLEKYVSGKKITTVTIRDDKIFTGIADQIIGANLSRVIRRGKGIIIQLDNAYSLIAHVKMTGQFVYRKGAHVDHPHKHTRVIFGFADHSVLYYNDVRRFGWIKVVKSDEVGEIPFFKSLGKDPLSELTLSEFTTLLQVSSLSIKVFLMDQKRIAGIGNIYASEALFMSGIDPRRSANSISKKEAEKLFNSITQILQKSIALGGASEVNFRNIEGGKGQYQNHAMVYMRNGEKCYICSEPIHILRQSGRSTFFCVRCQT